MLLGLFVFFGLVRLLMFVNVDFVGQNCYFSYVVMVVFSNDFFIGNDNVIQFDLFSVVKGGKISFFVGGVGQVWDVGIEVNDFWYLLVNGVFGIGGGQLFVNQGIDEYGVVYFVIGNFYFGFLSQFLVLVGYQWGNLDFSNQGVFVCVDIEVVVVFELLFYVLMLVGLGLVGFVVCCCSVVLC